MYQSFCLKIFMWLVWCWLERGDLRERQQLQLGVHWKGSGVPGTPGSLKWLRPIKIYPFRSLLSQKRYNNTRSCNWEFTTCRGVEFQVLQVLYNDQDRLRFCHCFVIYGYKNALITLAAATGSLKWLRPIKSLPFFVRDCYKNALITLAVATGSSPPVGERSSGYSRLFRMTKTV